MPKFDIDGVDGVYVTNDEASVQGSDQGAQGNFLFGQTFNLPVTCKTINSKNSVVRKINKKRFSAQRREPCYFFLSLRRGMITSE